jgi:hypothetical protein
VSILVYTRMTSRFPTAAEFLSFPKPNYVDPETRYPLALAVVIPMTVIVIASISCRFYSRTVLIYTLGWDDWTMFLAAVSVPFIDLYAEEKCAKSISCCLLAVISCSSYPCSQSIRWAITSVRAEQQYLRAKAYVCQGIFIQRNYTEL